MQDAVEREYHCMVDGMYMLFNRQSGCPTGCTSPCVPEQIADFVFTQRLSEITQSLGTNLNKDSQCVPAPSQYLFAHLSRYTHPCSGRLGRTSILI
jgi:hypothetical protein